MATRLDNVVVDAADPLALAGFWSAALGLPITYQEDHGEVDVGLPGFDLVFVPVPEPKTTQNRVHLDLASDSAADQAAIVDRLLGLGARSVDIGQGDVPWVVLADPEGNEFCVLEPRDEYRGIGPVAAVVVAAQDPLALARFWAEAAGRPLARSGSDWASLAADAGAWLEFVAGPAPHVGKNRVHLDVRPPADADQAVEVTRLLSAGAEHTDVGQGDSPWVVLVDPEGNEFCLLRPAG